MAALADDVIQFWFEETPQAAWFRKDAAFDDTLRRRFGDVHEAGVAGELWGWRTTDEGRLAEVIVLDQWSRNLHRDTPRAFAADGMALVLAQHALDLGVDQRIDPRWRSFLYMPFMHAESRVMQARSVALFAPTGGDGAAFALAHQRIVDRFGRFPHRNAILGRPSTDEELAFLREPGSSF